MYLFLYNTKLPLLLGSLFFPILILWVDLNDHLEKLAFSLKTVFYWFLSLEGEPVSTVSLGFCHLEKYFSFFFENRFCGLVGFGRQIFI